MAKSVIQEYEEKFNEPLAYPFGCNEAEMLRFESIVKECIATGKKYTSEMLFAGTTEKKSI